MCSAYVFGVFEGASKAGCFRGQPSQCNGALLDAVLITGRLKLTAVLLDEPVEESSTAFTSTSTVTSMGTSTASDVMSTLPGKRASAPNGREIAPEVIALSSVSAVIVCLLCGFCTWRARRAINQQLHPRIAPPQGAKLPQDGTDANGQYSRSARRHRTVSRIEAVSKAIPGGVKIAPRSGGSGGRGLVLPHAPTLDVPRRACQFAEDTRTATQHTLAGTGPCTAVGADERPTSDKMPVEGGVVPLSDVRLVNDDGGGVWACTRVVGGVPPIDPATRTRTESEDEDNDTISDIGEFVTLARPGAPTPPRRARAAPTLEVQPEQDDFVDLHHEWFIHSTAASARQRDGDHPITS